MRQAGPRAALAALAAAVALPAVAPAQDAPGYPLLTLGVSPGIELRSGLGSGSGDRGAGAALGLDFGLLDETPTQRLELGADAVLRAGDGEEPSLDGPSLSFGYDRRAPEGSLGLDARFRRDDIAFLRDLADFVGEDGGLELPDDFGDLEGEGIRQDLRFDARLSLREDRPLGVLLDLGFSDLSYEDATAEDLRGSRRWSLGAGLRLDLGAGRRVTAMLRHEREEEEGSPAETGWGLDIDAAAERPGGALTASLALSGGREDSRVSLAFGRALRLPAGSVSGNLGLAVGSDGDLYPTASLALRREHPGGTLALTLDRSLRDGDEGDEVATALAASFARQLTPRTSLSLDAFYAATAGGDDAQDWEASFGAGASYALTADWSLTGRARLRLADGGEDGGEDGEGTLFLGLSRTWTGTF